MFYPTVFSRGFLSVLHPPGVTFCREPHPPLGNWAVDVLRGCGSSFASFTSVPPLSGSSVLGFIRTPPVPFRTPSAPFRTTLLHYPFFSAALYSVQTSQCVVRSEVALSRQQGFWSEGRCSEGRRNSLTKLGKSGRQTRKRRQNDSVCECIAQ